MQMLSCFAVIFSFFSFLFLVKGGRIKRWPPTTDTPTSTVKLDQEAESLDSAVPFLKSFERKVDKLPPAQQQQLEASILQKVETEAAEEAKEAEGCVPDYSAPCPLSWLPRSDRETSSQFCDAPKDYKGYCEKSKSFDFFSENAKADWANDCEVKWPCKGEDGGAACPSFIRDYSLPCPQGFILTTNGETCEAIPGSYSGMCPLVANFTGFSDEAKKAWSMTCGAYWPCKEDCVSSYDAVCPEGWKEEEDLWCTAPSTYTATGRCDGHWNFRYFTKEMKKSFEESCAAHFPCDNTCHKDYQQICPKGWIKGEKNVCKLAQEERNACNINTASFVFMSLIEKKKFERECHVNWPCKTLDACKMDWALPCPVGWGVYPDNGKGLAQMTEETDWLEAACRPPINNNKGECTQERHFASQEEKRKFASMCNLQWPCIEEIKEEEKRGGVVSVTTRRIEALTGIRPRPPKVVTDRREVGKQGPVKHETGEIMPRKRRGRIIFPTIIKKEEIKKTPTITTIDKNILINEEEEARKLTPKEKEREAHRGYYGGLAVGYHLLGSST